MRFCILTEIEPSIQHGMGKYIDIIKTTLNIEQDDIYNIIKLTEIEIKEINTFDACLIHTGLLNKDLDLIFIKNLKQIKILKIGTVHSVLKEEIKHLDQMMTYYFPNTGYNKSNLNVVSDEKYQQYIDIHDALIFNTYNDRDLFLQAYQFNGPMVKIIPPLDHLFQSYSNTIKRNNRMTYMARVDYRKGLIATLNAFEFLKDDQLDVWGLIQDQPNKIILEHFLTKNQNIKYCDLVQDRSEYFNKYSIFFGNSLYEPLGFSHLEHLFNYVTPIIGKNTGTSEVFGTEWPFQVNDDVPELLECVNTIKNYKSTELKELHQTIINRLKQYTQDGFKEQLYTLIKNIKKTI